MKRVFIFAITVLFLANTSIVLAWYPPCMMDDAHSHEMVEAIADRSLPDCHKAKAEQPQEQQPETDPCDRLCLCTQASSSPSFTILLNESKPFGPTAAHAFPATTDFPASLNLSPLERPPNTVS